MNVHKEDSIFVASLDRCRRRRRRSRMNDFRGCSDHPNCHSITQSDLIPQIYLHNHFHSPISSLHTSHKTFPTYCLLIMSAETQPINPQLFAQALEALPLDALHSKAAELRNSIAHLKSSNEQMLPFAEEGDQDCKDAMFENLVVIGRMNERVALLRAEVERRGMRWADAEVEDSEGQKDGVRMVNGDAAGVVQGGRSGAQEGARSGTFTDEELRARLLGGLDEDGAEGDDDGVHL